MFKRLLKTTYSLGPRKKTTLGIQIKPVLVCLTQEVQGNYFKSLLNIRPCIIKEGVKNMWRMIMEETLPIGFGGNISCTPPYLAMYPCRKFLTCLRKMGTLPYNGIYPGNFVG